MAKTIKPNPDKNWLQEFFDNPSPSKEYVSKLVKEAKARAEKVKNGRHDNNTDCDGD
jgi:hypothetical protein